MICLLFSRARICKRLRSPGIDSGCPCSLAGRAGTSNRIVEPARQAGNRFLGSFKRFTNSGSELGKYGSSCQLPCLCLCDLVCVWRTVDFRKHDKSLRHWLNWNRLSLSLPLPKRILWRNTKVTALHPSTKEKYGRNREVITLPPSAQRETMGESPSLYQREKMWETQRSSLSLPLPKRTLGETHRSSLPFPLPNRIPRDSPSLYKREKMGETQSFHPSTKEK